MIETNDLQALVTGVLLGAVMKAKAEFLAVELSVEVDAAGNYLPYFYVTGIASGQRVKVEVSPVEGGEDANASG